MNYTMPLIELLKIVAALVIPGIAALWALFKWISSFLDRKFSMLIESVNEVKKEMQDTRVMHMAAVKDIEYLKDTTKEHGERLKMTEMRVDSIHDKFIYKHNLNTPKS